MANEEKLKSIFKFLKNNHTFNHDLQKVAIRSSLLGFDGNKNKIRSLLVDASQTQSNPKLDILAPFWICLSEADNGEFSSIECFSKFILAVDCPRKNLRSVENKNPITSLFHNISSINGFGEKTAALFVKNLVLIHLDNPIGYKDCLGFNFFGNLDNYLKCKNLELNIPVDRVILHIFNTHLKSEPGITWNFVSINRDLRKLPDVQPLEMIYWDDLWYWGFITQRIEDKNRVTKINFEKYMSWKTSSKSAWDSAIDSKAREFMDLLEQK